MSDSIPEPIAAPILAPQIAAGSSTSYFTPVKTLVRYDSIPLSALTAILRVVTEDEGGWILEHEPDGSDGDWTYGGMTAKTFEAYFDVHISQIDDALLHFPAMLTELKQWIICVYYQEFYAPLFQFATSHAETVPTAAHFSCGVNCGTETAKLLMQKAATGTKTVDLPKQFIKVWIDHYVAIAVENHEKLPDLAGWVSRAWKYLP